MRRIDSRRSARRAHAATSAIAAHAAPRKPGARSLGYKVTAPLFYAVNAGTFDVTVYRAKPKDPTPLATISESLDVPFGACIDDQGTLYVTNEPPSGGWVSEYPLGKTTPSKIITDGIKEPAYCAIDAQGNLWVANAYGANVTEYLYGSKKPHAVISKGIVYPLGVAFDSLGNLLHRELQFYVGARFGKCGRVCSRKQITFENDHKRHYLAGRPRRRFERDPLRCKSIPKQCRGISVRTKRSVPDDHEGDGPSGRPDR